MSVFYVIFCTILVLLSVKPYLIKKKENKKLLYKMATQFNTVSVEGPEFNSQLHSLSGKIPRAWLMKKIKPARVGSVEDIIK